MPKVKINLLVDSELWERFRSLMYEKNSSASAELEKLMKRFLDKAEKERDTKHES